MIYHVTLGWGIKCFTMAVRQEESWDEEYEPIATENTNFTINLNGVTESMSQHLTTDVGTAIDADSIADNQLEFEDSAGRQKRQPEADAYDEQRPEEGEYDEEPEEDEYDEQPED